MMLRAVAVASPGTRKWEKPNMSTSPTIRNRKYSAPARRAVALIEFMSSLQLLAALECESISLAAASEC